MMVGLVVPVFFELTMGYVQHYAPEGGEVCQWVSECVSVSNMLAIDFIHVKDEALVRSVKSELDSKKVQGIWGPQDMRIQEPEIGLQQSWCEISSIEDFWRPRKNAGDEPAIFRLPQNLFYCLDRRF